MAELTAGAARAALTPRVGASIVGYHDSQATTGIHAPIYARALVLDDGRTPVALCSVEVCFFTTQNAREVRSAVAAHCDLPAENVFVFATHTHAAPAFWKPDNWEHSPIECIAEAVTAAFEARQPARIGMGFGLLQGYSVNRRFLNRPVDPSLGVVRVDTADGAPLAVLGNFGCHAVVLGADNDHISGDWPGCACRQLEVDMGGDFVALFSQSGAGDVNPLTETVRQRLAAGHPVQALGATSTLYGTYDSHNPAAWDIGNRRGGTLIEAETIALAYNAELKRVWRSINSTRSADIWTAHVPVDSRPAADEPPVVPSGLVLSIRGQLERIFSGSLSADPVMDMMVIGINNAVLVGHPGETFAENAVALRKLGQQNGVAFPLLITYANGWYTYLSPADAYAEGGYEVAVSQSAGLSCHVQDRLTAAMVPHFRKRCP